MHPFQSLFLNKVAGVRPKTLLEKRPLIQVFSSEYCKIFKSTYFEKHCERLLLFYALWYPEEIRNINKNVGLSWCKKFYKEPKSRNFTKSH